MLTFAREVIINFRSKTRGLYEIIEPVLEPNEVFDSSLLKDTINSLIASGKRNFAIDLSPLDYIYSDTINMLMALNRRVMDVTGRLSLMAPQPEVMQILKRAGINNILKVFETETELIRSSEDMILQTTSIKLSDVNAAMQQHAAQKPESEFDQLRSEIGSVFGDSTGAGNSNVSAQSAPSSTGNAEFDEMFHQFEPQGHSQPNAPWGSVPPVHPQTPKFNPQQYAPSSPQSMSFRPSSPTMPPKPDADFGSQTQDFSTVRSETQRFSSAPGRGFEDRGGGPSYQKPLDFDEEVFEGSKKKEPVKKSDFDSLDDDFITEKKSFLPIVIIVLLVVVLIGAVAYFVTSKKGKTNIVPKTTTAPSVPEPIAKPVETPKVTDSVAAAKDTTPTAVEEVVESKPKVTPKPPVKPIRKKPIVRRKPKPRYTRPKRTVTPKPVTKSDNKIAFSSYPSGAAVIVNGKRVGTTPYTWTKPFFGKMNVQVEKPGYETSTEAFNFTGGSISKSFSLSKKIVTSPVIGRPPEKKPVTPLATPSTRKSLLTSPSSLDDEESPFDDLDDEEDDDFSLDDDLGSSEPVSTTPSTGRTTPSTSSTASLPSTPTTPTRQISGDAQIFIASIPPVADVYLGNNLVGKTNVSELKLPAGTQSLRFVKGGKEITKVITLKPGKNPSQMVRIP